MSNTVNTRIRSWAVNTHRVIAETHADTNVSSVEAQIITGYMLGAIAVGSDGFYAQFRPRSKATADKAFYAHYTMDVKDVLHEVIAQRGAPGFIRSDNGPEFIARDLGIWLAVQDIGTRFIQPGKPWQNGFAESFHSRLREECLNQEVFYSARHAQVVLDGYREFFNARRPHSSLSYRTPDEFARQARGRPDAPLCGQDTANVVVRPSPGQAGKAHGVPFS